MPSQRQEQVNSLIHKTLGEIILAELDLPPDVLLTITRVDCSPSLEDADIYLSVFPDSKAADILQRLEKNIYHLQKILDKEVVLRFVPKIRFRLDEGIAAENRMNEILDSLEK